MLRPQTLFQFYIYIRVIPAKNEAERLKVVMYSEFCNRPTQKSPLWFIHKHIDAAWQ